MSARDAAANGPGGRVADALDHDLVGRSPRRAAGAVAYLLGVVALFAARYVGRVILVGDDPLEAVAFTRAFDWLSGILIAVTTATVVLAPLVYAVWNGGPGLAAAIPLVPVALGDLVAGRYVLDLDWAIAVTMGATAAALAVYAADVRRNGAYRPWREGRLDEDALLLATGCTACSLVVAGRFAATAPGYVREWYAPFAAAFVVPIALLGRYWTAWLSNPDARRESGPSRP